jgi:hypothetical protein
MTSKNEFLQELADFVEVTPQIKPTLGVLLDMETISLALLEEISESDTQPETVIKEIRAISEHPRYAPLKESLLNFWRLLAAAVKTPNQDLAEVYTWLKALSV